MCETTLPYIRCELSEGKFCVESPFHPDFASFAKSRNGLWSGGVWVFDSRDEAAVREHAIATYGHDGSKVPDLVTCRVSLDKFDLDKSFFLLGREVAHRAIRDARVRLGSGVVIIAGSFPTSGGSAKNPRLYPAAGTILEVRDVPFLIALEAAGHYPEGAVTFTRPDH